MNEADFLVLHYILAVVILWMFLMVASLIAILWCNSQLVLHGIPLRRKRRRA
jgi:hypothetical protein